MSLKYIIGTITLIPLCVYTSANEVCDKGYAKGMVYNTTSMNHSRMKYALTNFYRDVSADTDRALINLCKSNNNEKDWVDQIGAACKEACKVHAPKYSKPQKDSLKRVCHYL